MREVRIASVRALSEQAGLVAEAGFNKIRAQVMVRGAPDAKYLNPVDPQTEPFKDADGNELGTYTLTVTQTVVAGKTAYVVVSDGVLVSSTARRTVSGTITKTGATKVFTKPVSLTPVTVWVTSTTFNP